jgi:hypothetical protein
MVAVARTERSIARGWGLELALAVLDADARKRRPGDGADCAAGERARSVQCLGEGVISETDTRIRRQEWWARLPARCRRPISNFELYHGRTHLRLMPDSWTDVGSALVGADRPIRGVLRGRSVPSGNRNHPLRLTSTQRRERGSGGAMPRASEVMSVTQVRKNGDVWTGVDWASIDRVRTLLASRISAARPPMFPWPSNAALGHSDTA